MRDESRLLIVVGKASLITSLGCFALVAGLTLTPIGPDRAPSLLQEAVGLVLIVIPVWISARWLSRTLRESFTKRETRAVTTAFAGFSPVWFGMAILSGELSGGYVGQVLKSGALILPGVLAGFAIMATAVSFAIYLITLRVTRRTVVIESTYA